MILSSKIHIFSSSFSKQRTCLTYALSDWHDQLTTVPQISTNFFSHQLKALKAPFSEDKFSPYQTW